MGSHPGAHGEPDRHEHDQDTADFLTGTYAAIDD
jgi:hypothetical protein